jgi:multimeric flavodoxin WrbA
MSLVLAFKCSPRAGGNSDILVDEAAAGAREAGHEVSVLTLRELEYSGCLNCGGCVKTGKCHVPDDMRRIFAEIDRAEHILFGSPMFFMDVTWKAKAMIDRCQVYWARKFVLKTGSGRATPGGNLAALLVGGTQFKTLFDAPRLVLGSWAATLDVKLRLALTLRGIDEKGAVLKHPDSLARAREIGLGIAEAPKS